MTPLIQLETACYGNPEPTEEELRHLIRPIEDLCDEYRNDQHLAKLRELVDLALIDDQYNEPKQRMALIEWHKHLEKGLQAIYSLLALLRQPLPMKNLS